MVTAVSVKPSTGSTIAIILTLLGVGAVAIFFLSRGLKDFKLPSFPEIKLPEFKFPDIFGTEIPLSNVDPLSLQPKGFGIGEEQSRLAFRLGFGGGKFLERSFGARPLAPSGSVAGVRGRPLAQRAVARRIPTFTGTITTRQRPGGALIAGSEALFTRLRRNLSQVTREGPISNVVNQNTVQSQRIPNIAGPGTPIRATGVALGRSIARRAAGARFSAPTAAERRRRRGR